jgi:hypothetical protein
MSDNLHILAIWHLRRAVQDREFYLLPVQYFISVRGRSQGDMFKKFSYSVCTSTVTVSPDLISYSNCFSYEESENNEKSPDDLEPMDKEDIQIDYYCDLLYRPSIGALKKNYP